MLCLRDGYGRQLGLERRFAAAALPVYPLPDSPIQGIPVSDSPKLTPHPTGRRHCMNGAALHLDPQKTK